MAEGLQGLRYSPAVVAKLPARDFDCELCPLEPDSRWARVNRAIGWDHCHEHGVIRGALCLWCNRVMADVDGGLVMRVHGPGWSGWRGAAERLRWWRLRCPKCTGDYPSEHPRFAIFRRRMEFIQLRDSQGHHPECTRCVMVHAVYRIPLDGRARRVRRYEVDELNARNRQR